MDSESYVNGIPEDFPIDGTEHTPYGCSKLTGDLYTQDYGHRGEIDTGVFRMSCIYGTRQFGTEDQGWVVHFIISHLLGRPITIYGDGKQVRDVLFVSDLVEVFQAFLEKSSEHSGGVFNIGGGPRNTLSLMELLMLLEEKTGNETDVEYADWRPSDQKVYISDISKARRLLGWEPSTDVEKGMGIVLDWIKDNRDIF
jgi:CDP-paratose 2-epimerase